MLSKILVANRGEIAARVIRTIHDLGLTAVAVYADQDIDSTAVALADEAYSLGGDTIATTYLNGDKILEIAKECGADAIHPGYGFLSEVTDFAKAVADAGITWIGPEAATIEALGEKIGARRTATAAGVNPVPGTNDPLDSMDTVRAFAAEHGYPIVCKRSDGGGGRGIEVINKDSDIREFEQRHAFPGGDLDKFFLEKFVTVARHIETQCMRDSHGNFVVSSTRDCSVQRRNQKLIEEAPAPFLPEGVEETVTAWSKALFEHTNYVGLGTCEFLLTPEGDVYFLEVNPRLQVEHTVTEEVTGLDLVAEQIAIASGHECSAKPELRGHSIELRITSEDPGNDLVPTAGIISRLDWPVGNGVRVESGVRVGDTVTPDFDSMVAKLIITGSDRDNAIARARRALQEFTIEGLATPAPLFQQILADDDFAKDFTIGTRWFETTFLPKATLPEPFETEGDIGSGGSTRAFTVEIDGRRHQVTVPTDFFTAAGINAQPLKTQPRRSATRTKAPQSNDIVITDGTLVSPIQAIVVRVAVTPGQKVEEGDILMVLEAMKMEKYVHAPAAGTVAEVMVEAGKNVPANTPLLKFEEA
ncbi:acetyl/propionyl/methylcrotonyl-CoA carboxylase subunit alpha [Corynebacterium ulceribovis]|uniref:acetyl/propionyl/methylcrotonyl-CoA carboxylase subunit alpha n=1 Tax=Corynebacterium ulceribovis TaxID=487732 RepID=UPI0003699849|nr:biotin carboxylase N-terminal domain-containing protein [Corynebacterium ulceribovis]